MALIRTGLVAMAALGLTAVAGCTEPAPVAESAAAPAATPAPTPLLSVNDIMVGMIDNEAHVLWDAEIEGKAPRTPQDWMQIDDHAMQIAAAGMLIQLGGTGEQDAGWAREAEWRGASERMSAAAIAARAAAKAQNFPALVAANGDLVASCESCHKTFKPDLPTEGKTHQPHPT